MPTTTSYFSPPLGIVGGQTLASSAAMNVIYTSTDAGGGDGNGVAALGAGTYSFIQMTAGTDLFIGPNAGYNNVGTVAQANQNLGIGWQTLYNVTTGTHNLGVGKSSLYNLTTGGYNVMVGKDSGFALTTGVNNVGVGVYALTTATTGGHNTAAGISALNSLTTGSYNVGIGENSGYNNAQSATEISTDTYMVFVGYQATRNSASALTNGIAIGYNAQVTASNMIQMGNSAITLFAVGGPAASAGTTTVNSAAYDILGAYWSGSASVPYGFRLLSKQDATTPTAHLSINLNNNGTITELLKIDQAGISTFTGAINFAKSTLPASTATGIGADAGGSLGFNVIGGQQYAFRVGGTNEFNINSSGLLNIYGGITAVGRGVPAIYGIDNRSGLTAADGSATTLYAVPSGGGTLFRITLDIFATAYTSGTATYTITWTENGVSKTLVVTAAALNTLGTATDLINPDASTNITAQLTGTFVATVTVAGVAEQLG